MWDFSNYSAKQIDTIIKHYKDLAELGLEPDEDMMSELYAEQEKGEEKRAVLKIKTISRQLDIEESLVSKWVETNNYDLRQLTTIYKQIIYKEIYEPTLIECIENNSIYFIHLY